MARIGSRPGGGIEAIDILIDADLWDVKPEIMSAGYGFEGIEGVGSLAELASVARLRAISARCSDASSTKRARYFSRFTRSGSYLFDITMPTTSSTWSGKTARAQKP